MKPAKHYTCLVGLLLLLNLSAWRPANTVDQPAALSTTPITAGTMEFSYVYASLPEQLATADAVFIGHVTHITPAQWNQDSGAYFDTGRATLLPLHWIDITVDRVLYQQLELGGSVRLTVIGGSPVGSAASAGRPIELDVEHTLREGDQAVFMVRRGLIAWRPSAADKRHMRPTIAFISAPRYGYLKQGADGLYRSADSNAPFHSLDELATMLEQRRLHPSAPPTPLPRPH